MFCIVILFFCIRVSAPLLICTKISNSYYCNMCVVNINYINLFSKFSKVKSSHFSRFFATGSIWFARIRYTGKQFDLKVICVKKCI